MPYTNVQVIAADTFAELPAAPPDGTRGYDRAGNTRYIFQDGAWVAEPGGGGSALTLITVEINLGSSPRRNGKFNITGSGLTAAKAVLIQQAVGPYTGKGSRVDEVEMDDIVVAGKTTSTTNIECYWQAVSPVADNIKFNYVVSA